MPINLKMSNDSEAISAVEKLPSRENYSTWQFAMQSYLELDGLRKSVPGTETDEKGVARGRAKVVLTVAPTNFVHIRSAKTAKETWDCLKDAFDDNRLTRKVGLLRKMSTTK